MIVSVAKGKVATAQSWVLNGAGSLATGSAIGAQAVGIAQGALDAAVAYVQERQQFGRAIAQFQGVQFMLADMAMKLEAARQMVYVAAAKSERGDADLPFFGAAAKCYASDAAMEITTDAVQLFGGYGYTKDYPVEKFYRDAKIGTIYEGTSNMQLQTIAKLLLRFNVFTRIKVVKKAGYRDAVGRGLRGVLDVRRDGARAATGRHSGPGAGGIPAASRSAAGAGR